MAERVVDTYNQTLSGIAPLDCADHQFTWLNLDQGCSESKLSLVLRSDCCSRRDIEGLCLAQDQRLVCFPIATMGYEGIGKFVISQALSLGRVFHWSCMTTPGSKIATREPFYTTQQRQRYCRLPLLQA